MFTPIVRAAAIIIALLTTMSASALNSTGHRLAALIAWEQLDAQTRSAVVALLKKHERFDEDFAGKMPDKIQRADQPTKDKWIFAHAATWPDIARGFSGDDRKKYHHATWHYINEPLFLSADDEKAFRKNPDDAAEGYDVPVDLDKEWRSGMRLNSLNIMQALQRSTARMQRTSATSKEKAIDLCWILHLIGDLHQPLHASSLFSKQGFPHGDRGGNSIKPTSPSSLHSLWDSAVGTARSLSFISRKANRWVSDPAMAAIGQTAAQETDMEAWLLESYDIAWEIAYDEEILEAVAQQESQLHGEQTLEGGTSKITLTDDYREMAKEVGRERVVRAGYRLAEVIKAVTED